MTITLESAREIVDQIFTNADSGNLGPLNREDEGRERLPGILFQFQMADLKDGVRMLLQVYAGLGQIGGELWEQEARTLVRLSSLQHPGLPTIIGAGHKPEVDIAYVLTASARYCLDVEGAMGYMAEHKRDALRQFYVLSDALSRLHIWGILHRNLWPGAIEVAQEPDRDESEIALRLTRFEMSTLVSNLLRYVYQSQPSQVAPMQALYRAQGASALICFPPERLAFLYPAAGEDTLEDMHSDVYGLGLIAYQWFIEPLSTERLARIFGERCEQFNRDELRKLHREMKVSLTNASHLPRELAKLIARMLEWERKKRPTALEVRDYLESNYDNIEVAWAPELPKEAFLVSTAPEYFNLTLFKQGFLENDPATQEGWEELKEFITDDLRGGALAYSPQGYLPYQRGGLSEVELLKAKYVLIGKRAAYFCSKYEASKQSNPFQKQAVLKTVPEAVHIRYLLDMAWHDARHLRNRLSRQRLPLLEVVNHKSTKLEESQLRRDRRPSWAPLLRSVERDVTVPAWQIHFERSVNWLLDVHDADYKVRQYAFTRMGAGDGDLVRLRADPEVDDKRRHDRTLLGLYEKTLLGGRMSFGEFFDNPDESELFFSADDERTSAEERILRGRAEFVSKLSPTEITIKRAPDAPRVPERGWLMPYSQRAALEQLSRERQARDALIENQSLMQQLHRPRSLMQGNQPWALSLRDERALGGEDAESQRLLHRTREVVSSMLSSWPFFALHGPPGTGKTTVAAAAVTSALRTDPSLRILVSAQSNFSLDNMADRILRELKASGVEALSVRMASSGASEEKVKESIEPYLIQNQAERLVQRIRRACKLRLETGHDEEPLRVLVQEWMEQAESCLLELRERLRRGTNIVFATCSGASPRSLEPLLREELFDWVIIEEAAKAWPTELAIPLVRGLKWTLIGDYEQLPAFMSAEYAKLLMQCNAQENDQTLAQQTSNPEEMQRVFNLFRSLFEPADRERSREDEGARRRESFGNEMLGRPCERLQTQFRMHHPIGELVSRCFYGGQLATASRANKDGHGLNAPSFLRDHHLLWLNTQWRQDCGEEHYWYNPGEAKLIKQLIDSFRPAPLAAGPDTERLAILTPFRAQRDHLLQVLGNTYKNYVHTVDSFQGKEADIVIVSLVRSNDRPTGRIGSRIGFLSSYQRINVMLSRARRLLILVGNFAHFEQTEHADPMNQEEVVWSPVCKNFRQLGTILGAEKLFPSTDPTMRTYDGQSDT